MITVNDKEFEVYLDSNRIASVVDDLAKKINEDYKDKDPLLVGILNGSFVFTSDLVRELDFDPQISFIKLASYYGLESTGSVDELIGLKEEVDGRHILIIEDIVDTGNTLERIINIFKTKNIASIEIASLLFKSEVYKKEIPLKYFGLDIPNKFVIGYGLDYDGRGRALKDIYQVVNK